MKFIEKNRSGRISSRAFSIRFHSRMSWGCVTLEGCVTEHFYLYRSKLNGKVLFVSMWIFSKKIIWKKTENFYLWKMNKINSWSFLLPWSPKIRFDMNPKTIIIQSIFLFSFLRRLIGLHFSLLSSVLLHESSVFYIFRRFLFFLFETSVMFSYFGSLELQIRGLWL